MIVIFQNNYVNEDSALDEVTTVDNSVCVLSRQTGHYGERLVISHFNSAQHFSANLQAKHNLPICVVPAKLTESRISWPPGHLPTMDTATWISYISPNCPAAPLM